MILTELVTCNLRAGRCFVKLCECWQIFSSSHSTFQISIDAWIHDARFHDACILISTMYIWCSNAYILHASSDHLGACMMHDPWPWYMHVCIYPWCRGDCDERTDKQGDSRSRKKKYAQFKSTFGRSYYLFLWIIYKLTKFYVII